MCHQRSLIILLFVTLLCQHAANLCKILQEASLLPYFFDKNSKNLSFDFVFLSLKHKNKQMEAPFRNNDRGGASIVCAACSQTSAQEGADFTPLPRASAGGFALQRGELRDRCFRGYPAWCARLDRSCCRPLRCRAPRRRWESSPPRSWAHGRR